MPNLDNPLDFYIYEEFHRRRRHSEQPFIQADVPPPEAPATPKEETERRGVLIEPL